jgi:hypothetical protein
MASVEQLWSGIISSIQTAMSAAMLTPGSLAVDWPNINILQAVATGQIKPAISIFDRPGCRNKTRNMILKPALPYNFGTPGSMLTASASTVGDTQTVTITGSGTPLVNDAFFVAFTQWSDQFFAEYICNSSDTLSSALTNLTAAINAIPNSAFSASCTGRIITITNNSGQNAPVRCSVLNIGSYTQEIGRWLRELQVNLWTKTPNDRQTYGQVLENLFYQQESSFGIQLADQSRCRILVEDDFVCKDTQMQDLFVRSFIISCDYPILQILPAWQIAALDYVQSGST